MPWQRVLLLSTRRRTAKSSCCRSSFQHAVKIVKSTSRRVRIRLHVIYEKRYALHGVLSNPSRKSGRRISRTMPELSPIVDQHVSSLRAACRIPAVERDLDVRTAQYSRNRELFADGLLKQCVDHVQDFRLELPLFVRDTVTHLDRTSLGKREGISTTCNDSAACRAEPSAS